ncbi:MAG: LapA family protein [Caldisericum sp.]|uniref:LapA family protein n=1 Tax=Caldisericum TaxID=693074 RepID=UPI003C71215B
MKKLNFFIVLILIILLATILLIAQNYNEIVINFLLFKFNTTVGLFGIIMFFAGAVIVWLVSLTVHYLEISNLKRKLSECESKLIKSDKSQEETEVKEKQN